jgi:hypothetical protein
LQRVSGNLNFKFAATTGVRSAAGRVLLSESLEFAVSVSEILLLAAKLPELSNQAGDADQGQRKNNVLLPCPGDAVNKGKLLARRAG